MTAIETVGGHTFKTYTLKDLRAIANREVRNMAKDKGLKKTKILEISVTVGTGATIQVRFTAYSNEYAGTREHGCGVSL